MLSNPITAIAGAVFGVFTALRAHHAKAVKTEAAALNAAVPATEQSWQQVFSLVNSGQLDETQASSYLDQSLQQYKSLVYDQYGVKQKSGNGPDVVFQALSRSVDKLKSLLSGGSAGSVTLEKTYANAGYQGTSEISISYAGKSASSVSNVVKAAAANPGKALLIVLGVLIFLWVMSR